MRSETDIEADAKKKARVKGRFWFIYTITDNPYRYHKKNSVKWHNAFYEECKVIGRKVM